MSENPLVSIIINNYNYERFLSEAIDSALSQTYSNTELVVVDDGSTDNSQQVIATYGNRIVPVLKANGGQESALNAGFQASRGEVICFLDSDDALLQDAIRKSMELFADPDVVKVQWPLSVMDQYSVKKDRVFPRKPLAEGDLRDVVIRKGPHSYVYSPTSGNAWRRNFLERVFPVPELGPEKIVGDAYLSTLAPIFGRIRSISEPQGCYRVHGSNRFRSKAWGDRARVLCERYDQLCRILADYLERLGVSLCPMIWKERSRFYSRYQRCWSAAREIAALVPQGDSFILVDQREWGGGEIVSGRHRIPFPERGGKYAGPPPDEAAAIVELDRQRRAGVGFIVFGWPAFPWLEQYPGLHQYLRSNFRCSLENDRLVVFDIRRYRVDWPAFSSLDRSAGLYPGPGDLITPSRMSDV